MSTTALPRTSKQKHHPSLDIPDPLFLGIDIGKEHHHVGFLSATLLKQHKQRYEACPTREIANKRTDFEGLLRLITQYGPPERCHVLFERTGHYGQALEQYLEEAGCVIYHIQAAKRYSKNKTDKDDARALAVKLYTQIGLRAPVVDRDEQIHRQAPPAPVVRRLRRLVGHRAELIKESVRRQNKLTAIADELFPELTEIYKDPNGPSALALRDAYPTPAVIAQMPVEALQSTRIYTRPGNAAFVRLKELAVQSIGNKDTERQMSLILEQHQLIRELRMVTEHIEELDTHIEELVPTTREGQILMSLPSVSPVTAGILLAGIGNVDNFESASKLRGYMGWSPKRSQTGTSYDKVSLDKSGNAMMKGTMYMVTKAAIRWSPRWKKLYERLVAKRCGYDTRKERHVGKMKILGRVAGQIIGVIFVLLRDDANLVAKHTKEGTPIPPPVLYDASH